MKARQPWSRWALWVCAVALLLKAAMPLLASASAQAQGKTLVEVCTVYGVALVPLDGSMPHPGGDPSAGHAAEHCALTALAALAPTATTTLAVAAALPRVGLLPSLRVAPHRGDACAAWFARLEHGPPARA